MKVTVRVDVERHVRDEAARQLEAQVSRSVTRCESCSNRRPPDVGRTSGRWCRTRPPSEAIEAARRGEVVELGTPAEAIAELNRDD